MIKKSGKILLTLVVGAFLASCAAQKIPLPATTFKPCLFQPDQFVQKVDNFMVILDESQSMGDKYKGQNKLNIARDIVNRMNQTIPDLKLTAALRTFGEGTWSFIERTDLIYGLTGYTKSGLEGALQETGRSRGLSPLDLAMDAANEDLKSAQGNIAVIIVSDGVETEMSYAKAIKAAKNMNGRFGERVCIYTIMVGNDPDGKKLLGQLADASGCGFSVNAEDIASCENMADFVEKVFLARPAKAAPPKDSDGDGVTDDLDQCPDTPKGVKVDARGCPLDTDGDGVYDYLDRCPGTPEGAKVNEFGCWVLEGVLFDTDKSIIKAQYYPILDEAFEVLRANPGLHLEIQGHTDSIGSAKYNRALSERRAKAVMEYFVKKGIYKGRLSYIGYGLTMPIASNLTPEGRAKNRRVELNPVQ